MTVLALNEEYHLAGVWDGEEARLYVNGVLAGRAAGEGPRQRNGLPLVIGGDADASGAATRLFSGEINDVRLVDSRHVMRAIVSIFRSHDSATTTRRSRFLNSGSRYGRLHPDESTNQAHGFETGDPELQSPPRSWMVEEW